MAFLLFDLTSADFGPKMCCKFSSTVALLASLKIFLNCEIPKRKKKVEKIIIGFGRLISSIIPEDLFNILKLNSSLKSCIKSFLLSLKIVLFVEFELSLICGKKLERKFNKDREFIFKKFLKNSFPFLLNIKNLTKNYAYLCSMIEIISEYDLSDNGISQMLSFLLPFHPI
ncbi:hypothetical protein BpHYR1_019056 [Brachionus plicatilis]|uniref:Uncharacterized protein n=1 Tax=Brachionus plicatilis TaxID=10195 RepID=A0A3M7P4E7_BRAPC|nr:hypothetical protein BpHYR1_019056 [Brachionus plicatilis]